MSLAKIICFHCPNFFEIMMDISKSICSFYLMPHSNTIFHDTKTNLYEFRSKNLICFYTSDRLNILLFCMLRSNQSRGYRKYIGQFFFSKKLCKTSTRYPSACKMINSSYSKLPRN